MFPRRAKQARLYVSLLCFSVSLVVLLFYFDEPIVFFPFFRVLENHDNDGTAAFPRNNQVALQNDPPPIDPPFASVIVAGQKTTNLSWTGSMQSEYLMYAYNVDEISNPDPHLRIPANKGREAMVYLSWIIDNYDDLPWAGVFVHGHAESWHQPDDIVRLITGLNLTSLARAGYISLRCHWSPSCPAEIRPVHHDPTVWGGFVNEEATERAIVGNWPQLFPSETLPETIASPCCAQFAVTRQTLRRRSKTDYERLRNWLLDSLLPDDFSGRVLEKLWAYMFTGNAVHCPPPKQCFCEYFTDQCDSYKPETPPEGVQIPYS